MKILSGMLGAVAVMALLAGPALAQDGRAKYGEPDKGKTPTEIAAEKDAERAYQRSLGNIPAQKSQGPGGSRARARRPNAAKAPPAKPKAKTDQAADTKAGKRKIEDTGSGAHAGITMSRTRKPEMTESLLFSPMTIRGIELATASWCPRCINIRP